MKKIYERAEDSSWQLNLYIVGRDDDMTDAEEAPEQDETETDKEETRS